MREKPSSDSPTIALCKLAYRHDDIGAASELAALSLIRPSTTVGHLGDVVGDKLIYDAGTAHGGSGGPVFNSKGEVIAVNSAFIDGFSGGTLGIASDALRPLVDSAQHQVLQTDVYIGAPKPAEAAAQTMQTKSGTPPSAHVIPGNPAPVQK